MGEVRFWIELVKEATSIVFVKDAGKAPWVVLERLDVLNLNKKDVAWLGRLDLKWSRQVVDLSQINILDIVGTVVVPNLAACPVKAFDLDNFTILDGAAEGNYDKDLVAIVRWVLGHTVRMPSVLRRDQSKNLAWCTVTYMEVFLVLCRLV